MSVSVKERLNLELLVSNLKTLVSDLKQTSSIFDKLALLNQQSIVQEYLSHSGPIKTFLSGLNPECDYVIKSIIAIGQAPIVFNMQGVGEDKFELLRQLLQQLIEVENFYQPIGGIIGYYLTILEMIANRENLPTEEVRYIHPEGLHLDKNSKDIQRAIRYGIENLPHVAEIYPVGGAGDRLNLTDPLTQIPLPAALLAFNGRTLLEELVRDLQAREYLYFKLYHKQLTTPIAMMTSSEKNNHHHIIEICQHNHWFGRSPQSFFFFMQPLVPVVTIDGNLSLNSPLKLTMKPGGHGVIWKLAHEKGVFSWLSSQGYQKSIVRQINNPLAGIDFALLAFIGFGCHENKALGFISCERLLNTAEGTNVLIEKKTADGFEYCLTNIEYTDFHKKGIGEVPEKPGSPYSTFPANTNILFIDIPSIEKALNVCPFPGQLINMKTKVPYIDAKGHRSQVEGGRLESTMQNIADCFTNTLKHQIQQQEWKHLLKTFIVYNPRIKTISTTKKSYVAGESTISTPEQAFYDILINNIDLLKNYCHFTIGALNSIEDYIEHGPQFLMTYHPALGSCYSIIAQKLRHGTFHSHSELQLEIAEADIFQLELNGSLLILSSSPLGHLDDQGYIKYGKESRCYLHNVRIANKGINYNAPNCFWKNAISRHESTQIVLNEGSEFYAENVHFNGSFTFEVPPHHRLIISQNANGQLHEQLEKIEHPSWNWQYAFNDDNSIDLTHKLLKNSTSV